MNRLMIGLSLVLLLSFTPVIDADSSSSGGSGGSSTKHSNGGYNGVIESATGTNFSIAMHGGRHHRGGLKPIAVHFNPDAATVTVDGVAVKALASSAVGKYASVSGTMKNSVLEATSITITSARPHHHKKSGSTT